MRKIATLFAALFAVVMLLGALASASAAERKFPINGKTPGFALVMPMAKGDSILIYAEYSGKPDSYVPLYTPEYKTSPGQPKDVLTEDCHVKRLDAKTIQVCRYIATRGGDAEIVFVDSGGNEVSAIAVTVAP